MTTTTGNSTLIGAAISAAVAGLSVAGLGALLGGSTAGVGALVGAALAVVVFCFGAFSVNLVARVMPTLSLLFALLTYLCQVVLLFAVFVALSGSGLLGRTLDREWLGGAVIVATMVWMAAQTLLATRARILIYDLPEVAQSKLSDAGAR